ncbi:hypothetical protein G6F56_013020 [Rhizopus delemar]|nr:hypothetical protein G6F56_013020 [Rhizopus delemar]
MDNINNTPNENVETNKPINLSEEQQEALYQQFAQRFKAEQQRQQQQQDSILDLPESILEELNQSSRHELQTNAKRFQRDIRKYLGGDWTKTPIINKPFVNDLKRHQLDAKSYVTSRHEDAEKLKNVGRAAAEIYEGLEHFMQSGDEDNFLKVMEKCRRLSIYSFATSSDIEREAREVMLKALHLPQQARHLEDQEYDEDSKKMVISPDDVEKIHQARYENSVIRSART